MSFHGRWPMMSEAIGILGGTFDPVHMAHLRMALVLYQTLPLSEMRLIPCHKPVHKPDAVASAQQRLAMLQQAVVQEPGLVVDGREITRATASYMVETLESLREEFGARPLCLILGSDSLLSLPTWHRWQSLMTLAHILVVMRPGFALPETGEMADFIKEHRVHDFETLVASPAGCLWQTTLPPLAISATDIRRQVAAGLSPRYLLPDSVWDYMQAQGIYK